jgi:hypothetical protein
MSFELRMILIYTVIFAIIGLFVWLYIITKNKRENDKINKDIDYSNDYDDPDDDNLSSYEDYTPSTLGSRRNDFVSDELDDFLNNFTYRDYLDDEYEDVIEESIEDNSAKEKVMEEAKNISTNFDYTISISPVKANTTVSEVLNILIGNKAYIFLANGNKLNNGEKIILNINEKEYPGIVVKSNYRRDLSSLKVLPKPLVIVKKID